MKNSFINRAIVSKIAHALGAINERAVYVGGAVVSLYADDPAADDVRPTKDLDITLDIVSFSDLAGIERELAEKGFKTDHKEKVICRFTYEDILVDVMATKEIGWAPSNKWFKPGFDHLQIHQIDTITIKILPVSYFLATKFTAFHDRGKDPRTSHDFEDIVYIIDNRINLVDEIRSSPADVKEFLIKEFHNILRSSELQEAILGNLYYETQSERYAMIMDKIGRMTGA